MVFLRALATVDSRATLNLGRAQPTTPDRLRALLVPRLPTRSSTGIASKPLCFDNVRLLKSHPRQHQPQHFSFDLAREGVDFFIWKIEVASGLSQLQSNCLQRVVEDEMNCQAAAGSVSKDGDRAQGRVQDYNTPQNAIETDPTTGQEDYRVRAVAMYDVVVKHDALTDCKIFSTYPVGKDPTATFTTLHGKDQRFLSLSRTIPIIDALRGANTFVRGASSSSAAVSVD